ncbi:hypothetical protein BGZ49_008915 [Haplosporangium sp. Z 27]|nr:hypothetical protein BGZ49_008915 [Haplosporangium sp. Z 27]
MPKKEVFKEEYFEHGLRMDPEARSLVVYIPDIDYDWVMRYISFPFRSGYIVRVLDSLLNIRSQPTVLLQKRIAEFEHAQALEKVLAMDINMDVSMDQREQTDQDFLSRMSDRAPKLTLEETTRQKRIQCLVHGTETNIDQDMWRLHALYRGLLRYEEKEIQRSKEIRDKRYHLHRSRLPKSLQLQLMIRNDGSYLERKEGVRDFDKYFYVMPGEKGPQSPIISALPHPRALSTQIDLDSEKSLQDACLEWTQKALTNEQKSLGFTTAGPSASTSITTSGESDYQVIDIPELGELRITDE